MSRLAIRTGNFRLSFKLIEKLRLRSLEFEVIDVNQAVPNENVIWFSSPSEILEFPSIGTPIPVEVENIDSAILSAIFHLKGSNASVSMVIGIDPGVSGSICFFKDGKILDVIEMPTMNEGKKNKKQVNGAQIYLSLIHI